MYKSLKNRARGIWVTNPRKKKSNNHEAGKVHYNTFPHSTEQELLQEVYDTKLFKTPSNEPIIPWLLRKAVNQEVNPALVEDTWAHDEDEATTI